MRLREEILNLYYEGLTSKEISVRLELDERFVRLQIKHYGRDLVNEN